MSLQWSWYLGENKRRVEGADAPTPANDEFWQKVVKTIPVIVVSAYTAAAAAILSMDAEAQKIVFAIAVVIGFLATVGEFTIVRKLNLRDPDKGKRTAAQVQVGVALLAFAVWSYAQADWAVAWKVFDGVAALLLVIAMAVVIHFADAIKKGLGG